MSFPVERKKRETVVALCASLASLRSVFLLLHIVHESGRSSEGSRDVTRKGRPTQGLFVYFSCDFGCIPKSRMYTDETRMHSKVGCRRQLYSVLKFQRERIKVRWGARVDWESLGRAGGGQTSNNTPIRLHALPTTNLLALTWLNLLSCFYSMYFKSERWAGPVGTGLRSVSRSPYIGLITNPDIFSHLWRALFYNFLSRISDRYYWWTSIVLFGWPEFLSSPFFYLFACCLRLLLE